MLSGCMAWAKLQLMLAEVVSHAEYTHVQKELAAWHICVTGA